MNLNLILGNKHKSHPWLPPTSQMRNGPGQLTLTGSVKNQKKSLGARHNDGVDDVDDAVGGDDVSLHDLRLVNRYATCRIHRQL